MKMIKFRADSAISSDLLRLAKDIYIYAML